MSRNNTAIDRRSVLKRLGATGTAATALGAASASSAAAPATRGSVRPLPVERLDVERIYEAVAGQLLTELFDAGLIDAASASALDTDVAAVRGGRAGRGTFGLYIDDAVGERSLLATKTPTDGGVLTLYVQPERDLSYATLEPEEGDDTLLYAPGQAPERVSAGTSSSCPGCTCYPNFPCNDRGGGRMEVCWVESTGGLPCVEVTGCC
ncbi:hypothetical protein [Halovivax limisalsi]|uniref:hypothetical protein n=1 Tax=Halovivax limisalsi TaxID=1453760 RepID=UPI001FFC2F64|nr:hypothetical protein [Halovivax limisalsi]